MHVRLYVLVTVALALLLMASSALSATTIKPVVGLTLNDARGQLVGTVIDVADGQQATVVLKVGTRMLLFHATRDGLRETGNTFGTPLMYASIDCSGEGFDAHNPDDVRGDPINFFQSVVFMSANKLYTASGPAKAVLVKSMTDEQTGACEVQGEPFEVVAVPLQFLTDLPFQSPFAIRGIALGD